MPRGGQLASLWRLLQFLDWLERVAVEVRRRLPGFGTGAEMVALRALREAIRRAGGRAR